MPIGKLTGGKMIHEYALPLAHDDKYRVALSRAFDRLEGLLPEYRAVADDLSYAFAVWVVEKLARETARVCQRKVPLHELEAQLSQLITQRRALASAIRQWCEEECA